LLPLLNDPCFILAVLLTSQISVFPGAQVSLADTVLGGLVLLPDAQADRTSTAKMGMQYSRKFIINSLFS